MNCEECGCEIGGWESICEKCEKEFLKKIKELKSTRGN